MLISLLLACVTTSESFWSQAGTLACNRYEECDKSSFEDVYDDQAECREEFAEGADDIMDCLEEGDCTYDPEEGADLLKDFRQADCNERDEEFNDITDLYDCEDETELALCLYGF